MLAGSESKILLTLILYPTLGNIGNQAEKSRPKQRQEVELWRP